jgi:hypothetical protein
MKSILPSFLLLLTAGLLHAQFITWTGPNTITGDSDIVTTGTYIDAVKTGQGGPVAGYTTANGVVFHTHTGVGAFDDGTIALSGDQPNGTNTGIGTASTPDSAYNAVLTGILYFYTGTATPPVGTATFEGLTSGDSYRIQVWNSEGANSGYPATSYTGSTPADTIAFANNYAIGTFTATATTASFSITDGGSFPMISAISLYEVPEPSTYAMLFGGLGMLVLISRFRSKLNA